MVEDTTKWMGNVIRFDEGEIRGHLTELVKGTVEGTLNAMLDSDAIPGQSLQRCEHTLTVCFHITQL